VKGHVKGYAFDDDGTVLVRVTVGDLYAEQRVAAEEIGLAFDSGQIVRVSVNMCSAKIEQAASERDK
jgi:hypothetical protein